MAKAMSAESKLEFWYKPHLHNDKHSQLLLLKIQVIHVQYFQQKYKKKKNQAYTLFFYKEAFVLQVHQDTSAWKNF